MAADPGKDLCSAGLGQGPFHPCFCLRDVDNDGATGTRLKPASLFIAP